MLTALSIRDVVLIGKLDLAFGAGLTVLTGETGAGKSILLDSLGLALGARAEASLVREGAQQAAVAASFALPSSHPALVWLAEQGLAIEEELVLRRVLGADGRSRAFVNDQPVSVATLRRLAEGLVELQGQHEQMGLADPARQAELLDAFGVPPALPESVRACWQGWHAALTKLKAARTAIAEAVREEEWLRHSVEELTRLAAQPEEEQQLAAERQGLQQAERRAEAVAAALAELTPRERRGGGGPAAALRAAGRALERLGQDNPALAVQEALVRAEESLAEAETLLSRLAVDLAPDPRRLEQAEERLFALRAGARKHGVGVAELPALAASLAARLAALEHGEAEIARLEAIAVATAAAYRDAAQQLRAARLDAASRLAQAVGHELPPLRLDRARFLAEVSPLPESDWGARGMDAVRFLIATNPGQAPAPLGKVASGGELSRLMLALKLVLSAGNAVPTLIFDEVDSGIGGATAAAVGERLARLASRLQVLVVTHSPQVAARGIAHLQVAKQALDGRAETRVGVLDQEARREEIARMLAGSEVTEAARAAAAELLRA